MKMKYYCKSCLILMFFLLSASFLSAQNNVLIEGDGPGKDEFMMYHKIVLTVEGPLCQEIPSTYKDHRMTVDFVNGSTKVTVSGYFAADGNAANSSATSGNKWRCNFRPEQTGDWSYTINFRNGLGIALKFNDDNSGSQPMAPDGKTGSFKIFPSNKTGKDFRNPQRGPLKYVNKHHYKYAGSNNYFIRAGMGIPENLFSNADFDNTPAPKDWIAHASDYDLRPSPDLVWAGGKGKTLMGAANYTISKGANTLYGVMFNIPGDGEDSRFPWKSAATTDRESFDVSKLEQWDRVLTHFNNVGVAFIFMFAETENEEVLDDVQLKLWYREAAARFGHHAAISFVLCEEMKETNATDAGLLCNFLKSVDGHDRPRGVHTPGNDAARDELYGTPQIPAMSTNTSSTYACVQTKANSFTDVYAATKRIRDNSNIKDNRTPWVISVDEARDASGAFPKTDSFDPNHDIARKNALWGNLMAGGMGVSMYTTDDLKLVSFKPFNNLLTQCGAAVNFFWDNNIPVGDMSPNDALVSVVNDAHCISTSGVYVIHLPNGGTPSLNLAGVNGKLRVSWLNTKTGLLANGTVTEVNGGGTVSLGTAPNGLPADKVILVSNIAVGVKYNLTTSATNGKINPANGAYPEGTVVELTAVADLGYKFSSWGGAASGSTNPIFITMNADKNVTANFVTTPTYKLNVTAVNGSVTFAPTANAYNAGSIVKLTPVPAPNYKFDSWSGDLTSTKYFADVIMNSNKNIIANFSIDTNLIKNGDFRQDITNWAIKLSGSTADGGVVVENEEAQLQIHVDNTNRQNILFEQSNITLKNGFKYNFNFDARAQNNRIIEYRFVSENSGTVLSFPKQSESITTTMKGYSKEWNHTLATGAYRLQILIAGEGSNDVWVDNLTLKESVILSQNSFEEENDSRCRIHLNQATDILTLDFAETSSNKKVTIFNTAGQSVYSTQTRNGSVAIEVKSLNIIGVVVVRAEIDGSIFSKKVIVK